MQEQGSVKDMIEPHLNCLSVPWIHPLWFNCKETNQKQFQGSSVLCEQISHKQNASQT